jgi:hypothetical protein
MQFCEKFEINLQPLSENNQDFSPCQAKFAKNQQFYFYKIYDKKEGWDGEYERPS